MATNSQIGTINVRVGNQNPTKVQTITYGARTLKSATDLNIIGGNTGDVIMYNANTKTFSVTNIDTTIGSIDGGIF